MVIFFFLQNDSNELYTNTNQTQCKSVVESLYLGIQLSSSLPRFSQYASTHTLFPERNATLISRFLWWPWTRVSDPSLVETTFGPKFTDLHLSPKERQLQKSCVSFGEECMHMDSGLTHLHLCTSNQIYTYETVSKILIKRWNSILALYHVNRVKVKAFTTYTSGPVGSIIYADLYGSIKIKFTVLIRDTDQ